jgi:chemotaxis protein MotB
VINRTRIAENQELGQWQTIYCSLMLLLVVLFIMLIAYSSVDRERFLHKNYIETKAKEPPPNAPDLERARESMERLVGSMGIQKDYTIIKTNEGFKAVVSSPVLFNSGDDALNQSVFPVLDGIIEIARKNDLEIQIEGHTDNVPINTPKFPSNWELSTMRAVNILRYLQKNGEIPSSKLIAVGYGDTKPVADNKTAEGRQKNRRIEILFRQVK